MLITFNFIVITSSRLNGEYLTTSPPCHMHHSAPQDELGYAIVLIDLKLTSTTNIDN